MSVQTRRRFRRLGDLPVRRSMKSKFVSVVTLLLLAVVVLFGGMVRASMKQRLDARWRDQAEALARNLALGAELGVYSEVAEYLEGPVRGAMELEDVRYVVVADAAGRTLYSQGDTASAGAAWKPPAGARGGFAFIGDSRAGEFEATAAVVSSTPPLDAELAVLGSSEKNKTATIGWVRLGVCNAAVRHEASVLTARLAVIGAFVLALGFVVSWTLARRVTDPLRRLAQAATAIGQGKWDHPVDVSGEDEIAYLAGRLRRMASDLHESEEEIREQNRTLELKVAERTASLSRALEELRELDKMKDAFLSSVSHELRTPLTAIRSFSETMLLYEDEPAETRREFLSVIHRESERLSRLIEDVLDLSKIQSGKRQWTMEELAIEEVVTAAAGSVAPLLAEKRLLLETPPAEERTLVFASRDGVHQVLQNLLGNAVKFSPEDTAITIAVASEGARVRVSVMDRGPGIPAGEIEKVFDRFHQVGDTLTGKPKGTGLGLAICREIVRQHKGEIWAESRDGGGTVFVFSLPAAGSEQAPYPAAAGESPAAGRLRVLPCAQRPSVRTPRSAPLILVVDDEASIRRHFEHELKRRGYDVCLAENGLEAIQKTRSRRPSLVLLDIMMPDIMGLDVIRILKNDPDTAKIPIVVVSVVEDRERGLKLGASDYLTKPVNAQALVERIEALLSLRRPVVLVVSGDAEALADVHGYLTQTRYRMECASTTEAAEERLAKGGVDLILLDAHDPTIQAPGFIRRVRTMASMGSIPVLVLTGQSVDQAEICSAAPGRQRCLPRDVGPASLTAALQEMLSGDGEVREAA